MTLDLSGLDESRRAPVLLRFHRERVAQRAAELYPATRLDLGDQDRVAELRAALIAEGHPESVCTMRFVRAAAREGR